MTLPIHPLANLFPLIEGAEFDELEMATMIRRIARDLPEPVIPDDMSDEELVRRTIPLFRSLTDVGAVHLDSMSRSNGGVA